MHTNTDTKIDWIVCLFGVYRSTREFILIWRRHHYRLRVANFNLCSVYRLYGHWTERVLYTPTVTSLKWSSPRTRDSHTYCREFGGGSITTCFNDIGMSRLGFEQPTFRLRDGRYKPLRHRRGQYIDWLIGVCAYWLY